MSFIHDIIKIKMTREGYLMNYPPHLISDDEMCDAFLMYNYNDTDEEWNNWLDSTDICFFRDKYPPVSPELDNEYRTLVRNIAYHINYFKNDPSDNKSLPNWVYSYMICSSVGPTSEIADIHDMLVLMDTDNLVDEYDLKSARMCYNISSLWLSKLRVDDLDHRPPTIYGEPHVIKALRIYNLDVVRVGG